MADAWGGSWGSSWGLSWTTSGAPAVVHLHGRPPRRRGRVGVLDRRYKEACDAALLVQCLEEDKTPKPAEVRAIKAQTAELLSIVQEAGHATLIGLTQALTELMGRIATEREARVRAAELAAKIAEELDEEESLLLLLS